MAVRAAMVDVAERALRAVVSGSLDEAAAVCHSNAVSRESVNESPAARGVGPNAFAATGSWLRSAFENAVWTTRRPVVENDVVVTYGTLSGRQTDFVVWTPAGTVERAIAPTGGTFAVQQVHFQRIGDGAVIEHWAVQDDQSMALQLGWSPPSQMYLWRCMRATSNARSAQEGQRAKTPMATSGSS
ncbi:MAG: ester cyclase [Rhodococcus sp. (in: high G+C Gram-positive bacteria)]